MSLSPYRVLDGKCVGSKSSGMGVVLVLATLSVGSRIPYGANQENRQRLIALYLN